MNTEIKSFTGYHCTESSNADKIVKFKYYVESDGEHQWLGNGVYFFINERLDDAKTTAKKWGKFIKCYSCFGIVETGIKTSVDRIINLDEQEWKDFYIDLFETYINKAVSEGIVFTSQRQLDNAVINDICSECDDFDMVIQSRYVNFIKSKYKDKYKNIYNNLGRNIAIPSSSVPNCTLLCVKKREIIEKSTIKLV
ncbi:hypothetical protein [Clostridium estertheticum]|uniref:hypothetical protein n=1 Tax=Clostridium estertheticum TaxID=238834 RepID=UPI001CF30BE6|nr:hypothetical protein [Clostridium estertheticum]MCB2360298.1 hypothetical protein [Clostridium estertheticum]